MIQDVTFERSLFHAAPQRFEAGTGNIADAVGLGAAHRLRGARSGSRTSRATSTASSSMRRGCLLRRAGPHHHRHGAGEGRRDLAWCSKGVPERGGGASAQQVGHRRTLGPSLRPADPAPVRRTRRRCGRRCAFYNTCGEIDLLVQALHDRHPERPGHSAAPLSCSPVFEMHAAAPACCLFPRSLGV